LNAATQARTEAEAQASRATAARTQAETARTAASEAKAQADAAFDEALRQVDAAEKFLQEAKSKPGVAFGAIWWLERELHEKKKYLPSRKGGIAKTIQ